MIHRSRRRLLVAAVMLVALAIAGGGVWWYLQSQNVWAKVLSQADFGVWYPPAKNGYTLDASTIQYKVTGSDKLITFVVRKGSANLSFTEQAVPESFTDVPQVYDKLIERLRGYSTFEGVNGKVDLTRPEELGGGQTAVMKARGTLVFVRPSDNLSVDDWRVIMNGLTFAH